MTLRPRRLLIYNLLTGPEADHALLQYYIYLNDTHISYIIKALSRLLPVLAAVMLASCDGMIYDEEGECDPHYKFVSSTTATLSTPMHSQPEVDEVTLYIVDTDGTNRVAEARGRRRTQNRQLSDGCRARRPRHLFVDSLVWQRL